MAGDLRSSPSHSTEHEKPARMPSDESHHEKSKDESTKDEKPKKGFSAKLKGLWAKTGLKPVELLIMAKGGIPPTIALAMYQATPVANTFTTLGYLVAIISIIGMCIMPRARFIQTLILNLFSVCIGAAMALLMIYSAVKARQHTTGASSPSGATAPSPGASLVTYNSSASVVSGVWLFFQIYLVNALKAKFPQLNFPVIMYSIFTIVAATYAPQFPTIAAGEALVQRLLEAFLAGLAIATGVSLIILPTTSRKVVFIDFTMYVGALKGSLDAYKAWLFSMEEHENVDKAMSSSALGKPSALEEAEAVRKSIQGVLAMHSKLQTDLPFAKREVAIGKLGPDDLKEINKKLRACMLPIIGLSSLVTIFERLAETQGWTQDAIDNGLDIDDATYRQQVIEDWAANIKTIHQPVQDIMEDMKDGLEHVLLRLELKKPAKADAKANNGELADDVEAVAESVRVGSPGFANHLEKRSRAFHNGKQDALKDWCQRKGIDLPADFFDHPATAKYFESEAIKNETEDRHARRQRQLYMLLYIEFLLYHTSQAILSFVRFADERVEHGKLKKNRLIVPGAKRLRKWFWSVFKTDDNSGEQQFSDSQMSENIVDLGDAYKAKKDPEHLAPTNGWQKLGNAIRVIPGFLKSSESNFGFRAAVATMSIGVINLLADTQYFFTQNRLLWAMIMIAISMTPTAGQSVFNFMLRVGGTVIAMVASLLIYYIPNGNTVGMLVLFWIFASAGFYIVLKKPAFVIAGIISIVSTALIVGYELEVRVIGQAAAESNGQAYLPVYLLGPYRLATVAGGLFVAWIWTIFPYPISEHSQVRQDLGGALYLLANFYSVIHETVIARARGDAGDESDPTSPGAQLEKQRLKVFGKMTLLLSSLKTHLNFVKWEIPIGGKFPKERYDNIVQLVENITNYIALIGYASTTFSYSQTITATTPEQNSTQWSTDFRRLLVSADLTTHEITTLLSLLSGAVKNGHPLPPYLSTPKPYGLSQKLESMDGDILSIRHINEPGYAAFAVTQVSSRCVIADMGRLLREVKSLVGELDFSFHIVSTKSTSGSSSTEDLKATTSKSTKGD